MSVGSLYFSPLLSRILVPQGLAVLTALSSKGLLSLHTPMRLPEALRLLYPLADAVCPTLSLPSCIENCQKTQCGQVAPK